MHNIYEKNDLLDAEKSSPFLDRIPPKESSRTGDHVQCICVYLGLGSARMTLHLKTTDIQAELFSYQYKSHRQWRLLDIFPE